MSLETHARLELEMAGLFDKDSDYGGATGKAVMELMEVFSNQGHSGSSASLVARIFSKLSDYKPLGPITGKDEEWGRLDVEYLVHDMTHQNRRLGSLFKQGDGRAYYGEAIIWSGEDDWDAFSGTVEGINSRHYVKEFPFTPKTFYIDCTMVYKEKDWFEENDIDYYTNAFKRDGSEVWEKEYYYYTIKDPKQLDEVFEYYERKL